MRNEFRKLAVFAWLAFTIACARVQPPPLIVQQSPLVAPIISHQSPRGCNGEHDRIYLPNVNVDAYPGMPPKEDPKQIVLHFSDGTTLWAKPQYGTEECPNYLNCHRATVILNPAWDRCSPEGISYEVATEDGKLLFDSRSWLVTQRARKASVHIAFSCGTGFAGEDFTAVSNAAARANVCPSQDSAFPQTGMALTATATALAGTYFTYRAAYDRAVTCVSHQMSNTKWSTNCY
jgi:hypothetical protein